jgi:hypothetical protein
MLNLRVLLILAVLTASSTATGQTLVFSDTPYLSFADSPFSQIDSVQLEDFEDGLFNLAGVSAVSNTPGTELGVTGGGSSEFVDSVDGDDGVIDGRGRDGFNFAEASNLSTDNLGYTFNFDSSVIGILPTHAGIVWVDGSREAPTQVEFFGAGGISLGVIGPFHISDDSFVDAVDEDRFFGAIHLGGIESFTIRSPGGINNLTVDHVQFAAVPEPSSALAVLAFGSIYALRRRRL